MNGIMNCDCISNFQDADEGSLFGTTALHNGKLLIMYQDGLISYVNIQKIFKCFKIFLMHLNVESGSKMILQNIFQIDHFFSKIFQGC